MKKYSFSFVLFVAIITIIFFLKNVWIKNVVTSTLNEVIGLSITIDAIDVGFIKPYVKVRNLIVKTPRDFGDEPLAVIPYIRIEYALKSLIKHKIMRISHLAVRIKRIHVVVNERGENSVERIRALDKNVLNSYPPFSYENKKQQVFIDRYTLSIEEIAYSNFERLGLTKNMLLDINERSYYRIHSFYTPVQIALYQALISSKFYKQMKIDFPTLKEIMMYSMGATPKPAKIEKDIFSNGR